MIWNRIRQVIRSNRGRSARGRVTTAAIVDVLESRQMLSAVTVQIGASRDTTIYTNQPDHSNGRGEFVVAGEDSRGLIHFDLAAAAIPAGSTIVDAVLTLTVGQSSDSSSAVSIHQVTSGWGEAGSDAPGNEHTGAVAQQFDATWLYTFFDGELWQSAGGDYSGTAATASVDSFGTYEWFGGGVVDDVQAWADSASTNFGWLIKSAGDTKAFISADAPDAASAPILEVTYEPPPIPNGIVEGRIWDDINRDGRSTDEALAGLGLQVFRSTYFNTFGGEEYWFRSANTQQWYYLTSDGVLTQWDGTSGELSGTIVTKVDPRYYYKPELVVQQLGAESWVNGRTVELLDTQGSVVATTTTISRDINGDGAIDPALEDGWYRFSDVPSDQEYSVRHVIPEGWKESGRINYDLSSGLERVINELDLQVKGSYFENYGGRGEKWLFSSSRGWFFITPPGDLYRWNGQHPTAENPLTGTHFATLGRRFHADPTPLLNGNFSDDAINEGDLLLRIDFGTHEAFTLDGRVWNDFHSDGERKSEFFVLLNKPGDSELGAGESFFFDRENDSWYIVGVDGHMTFWGETPENGGGTKPDPGTTVEHSQVEPWIDGRTVELVNAAGQVVAVTQSRSIDLNEDGEIQYETERGHYVFEDIPPGDYTVRTITDSNWLQTSPISGDHAVAAALDAEYGFRQTASEFVNWAGLNEKWFVDSVGRWYYILPNGLVYQWLTSSGANNLQGTLIADLSSDFYDDLSLLTDPDVSQIEVSLGSGQLASDIVFGNHRLLVDVVTR